jgi:hypothetical protein
MQGPQARLARQLPQRSKKRKESPMETRSRHPHLVALTFAASLTIGSGPVAEATPLPPAALDLALVWIDLSETAPEFLRVATLQVRGLLAPVGLRVSGRSVTAAGSAGPPGGVRVVLMDSDPSRRGDAHPVGGAARTDYGPQPTVWVFPAIVAGGLSLDLGRQPLWTAVQKLQFCRALAVVVLHELAHALVGAAHRPHGLMSATLNRSSLLDPRLTVDADLHPALRAAVARLEAAAAHAAAAEALPRVAASIR